MEFVGEAVMGQSGDARIAEAYLFDRLGCGIALISGLDVAFPQRAYARQARREFARHMERWMSALLLGEGRGGFQLPIYLMLERSQCRIEGMPHEIVNAFFGEVRQ